MEYREQVEDKLGSHNLTVLVEEIENGLINTDEVKQIALQMGGRVHGVYVEKHKNMDLTHVFLRMLDRWYKDVIFQPEIDGFKALLDILNKNIKLNALANEMKPLSIQNEKPRGDQTPTSSTTYEVCK
jgi:hypothetical protein